MASYVTTLELFENILYFSIWQVYNANGVIIVEMMRKPRKEKRMTMKELGEAVGLSQTAIHHYEIGDRQPPVDVLVAIADVLGCSLDLLVRGKEKEPSRIDRERLADASVDAFSNLSPEAKEIALAVLNALQAPPK